MVKRIMVKYLYVRSRKNIFVCKNIMDFQSENQQENHDEGLSLFDKPVYSGNFQSMSDVIIQPISPPGDSIHSSYAFIIGSKDDPLYTIPSSVKIFGRMRVCMQDGSNLGAETLSPTPNFPESVFENIAVSINGVNINDHGRGYHFKSFINKNLGIDKATKTSTLMANYWGSDELESKIRIENAELSDGFKGRYDLIKNSKDIFFMFAPMVDILTTERYLPPRTQLKIELERGHVNMCLLSPDQNLNPKIQVLEINMAARRFIPNSKICIEHEKRFLGGAGIVLPFTRSTIRHRSLHSGVLSTCVPAIFTGSLPYHFLVCILLNEQLCQLNYNPFIFKSHGLKSFGISKNGVSIPQEPIPVGKNDGSFLRSYTHFIENTGGQIFQSVNNITPNEYMDKSFFIAYDLTPDKCMGTHSHSPETGVIDLNLTFSSPTQSALTLLILANYESNVTITKDEVLLDYST
jgi:hypothetical protein